MENGNSDIKILSRRDFLALAGAGAGGVVAGYAAVHLPFGKVLLFKEDSPEWRTYVEKEVLTACQLCSGGCGLKVRTIDGFPVSIAGNSAHPVNQGGVCPKGLSALQSYYHPARIHQPMLKKNGSHVPVSWDEGLSLLGGELAKLRNSSKAQDVAFLCGDMSDLTEQALTQFAKAYGTSNLFRFENDLNASALQCCFGEQEVVPDFGRSMLVLSFGAPLMDASESPLYSQAAITKMRSASREALLIQIEPRKSMTAAKADQWLPVRPGTEGMLALGIAHVMIKENLYDAQFVRAHATGFDRFKSLVLRDYSPEQVSKATGVSADRMVELARLTARLKPAMAVPGKAITQYSNGAANAVAVNSLNALMGNLGKPGGLLKAHAPQSALKAASFEEISKSSPQILFVYNSNPCFYSPQPDKFRAWMEKVPVSVSFANIWDETAEQATLILPEHHFLDRWDARVNRAVPFFSMAISQPIRSKLLADTKHLLDILSGLATKFGEANKAGFQLTGTDETIKRHFEATSRTPGVVPFGETGSSGSWDALWDAALKKGGYGSDREASIAAIKADFCPEKLEKIEPEFDGDPREFRFHLHAYEPLAFSRGTGGDLPWLLENPAAIVESPWKTWVEINPESAKALGIADGETVQIESSHGKILATAKHYPAAAPDVISMPLGMGRKSYCQEIPSAGANVMSLVGPLPLSTRVQVKKS